MTAEYRFPNGDTLTSGIAIFERVLLTKETATATENATGSHAGAVLTFERVAELCGAAA